MPRKWSVLLIVLFACFSVVSASTKVFVYSGSDLVASVDEDVKVFMGDRLGSNRLSVGEAVRSSRYLPFGQAMIDELEYGFTGKELDESGLHYFGARYFDANLGRFTTVDPVQENHPYTYVDNNPMSYVDPSGAEKVALVYPYGYNYEKSDVANFRESLMEEGLTVDVFRFDPSNRAQSHNGIIDFVDVLHEKGYSEVFTTGHGIFEDDGFYTLSPKGYGSGGVEISWSDYNQRSWLYDFSCGSVCEFDPYSVFDNSEYLDLVSGFGENPSWGKLLEAKYFATSRLVSETPMLIRHRYEVKRIMNAYYGQVDDQEFFEAMHWGIMHEMKILRFGAQLNYDSIHDYLQEPLVENTDTIGFA